MIDMEVWKILKTGVFPLLKLQQNQKYENVAVHREQNRPMSI